MPSLQDISGAALWWLGWLVCPTRKVVDLLKVRGDRAYRGNVLRYWSLAAFRIELAMCVLFALTFRTPSSTWGLIGVLSIAYAWSRINEIAYAFYRDPLTPSKESDLTSSDRIKMAMRSYLGLAFNFAVLYYFQPFAGLFKSGDQDRLTSFVESVYFSGVTLATLGYGDITPTHSLSRLFALYEVFAGILIIAVAIATYVGGMKDPEAD